MARVNPGRIGAPTTTEKIRLTVLMAGTLGLLFTISLGPALHIFYHANMQPVEVTPYILGLIFASGVGASIPHIIDMWYNNF